jgi:hypothetical protein
MEIKTKPNLKSWGSESSRTDGLADTRVYKEVAMANTFGKTKSNLFVAAMKIYERGRATTGMLGSCSNPRTHL